MRAYLVTVVSEASRFERLVMTDDAAKACSAALDDVFSAEREKWAEDDQTDENPFWIESVGLVARTNTFSGSSGIITL